MLPVSSFEMHVTELTVDDGERGPLTLAAEIPPTTTFGYMVEFGVAGVPPGSELKFDEPVPYLLENYQGLPTGARIPAGSYNRATGAWEPTPDGRVIEILAIEVAARCST